MFLADVANTASEIETYETSHFAQLRDNHKHPVRVVLQKHFRLDPVQASRQLFLVHGVRDKLQFRRRVVRLRLRDR